MPVALCFFLSGAAALILQVLWSRMLGHVFGASSLAIATVLSVFMGGLALGSHLGGRWAVRLRRPLLAFAVLETAVGLYGLLVPSLLEIMPVAQRGLHADLGFFAQALVRFVMVSVILILPTTAMGATLPILAEGVVKRGRQMASQTGRLYAANTFGAVAGAFTAGFVLIPIFGITTTVYLAAGTDLFVALVVLVLWQVGHGDRVLVREGGEESADRVLARLEPVEVVPVSAGVQRLTLLVFALSGAAAMALEVLWSRTVGVIIGASTYSFTLILTTFLVGLATGAAILTRFIDRVRNPVRWLAWTEVLVAVLAAAGTFFVDRLPLWLHSVARGYGVTMNDIYLANFGIAATVVLPATLALGAVMPLVIRILAPEGDAHAGPIVGRAYAVNTMGAILGSFAAGFVLLPTLGVERGLALAALTSLALGVVLVWVGGERRRAALAAVLGAALILGSPSWDVRAWTAGLFRMYLARNVYAQGWAPSADVVFHRDGVATTITVDREVEGGAVSLKVNGKVDASDVGDMPTQVLSGLLPVLLHDDPKRVLVIGYGSGVTPGAVLQAPIEELHVAEIESAVYEAANTYFAHVNHRPHEDPRAKLVVDDGRNFLLRRDERYDIIISEPSNPWMTGAASLFTREFFQIAESRLADGGVFLQWLQVYELAPENIQALLRTFSQVFPVVTVFTPDPNSNDTFLVGSRAPLTIDRERIAEKLSHPRLAKELERANVFVPEDFFGLFLLGQAEVARFVGKGPINTDDNALIEFAAPKDLLTYSTQDARLPFLEAIEGRRLELTPKYFEGFMKSPAEHRLAAERLLAQGRLEDARTFAAVAREGGEDVHRIRRLLGYAEEADSQPVVVDTPKTRNDARYARVVFAMTEDRERDALVLFELEEDLENESPGHRLIYAYLCYRRGRFLDADYLMREVLRNEAFVRSHPASLYYGARIAMYRGKWHRAVALFDRFDEVQALSKPTGRGT